MLPVNILFCFMVVDNKTAFTDSYRKFGTVTETCFVTHILDMCFHGAQGHSELFGYIRIGFAVNNLTKNEKFFFGEINVECFPESE